MILPYAVNLTIICLRLKNINSMRYWAPIILVLLSIVTIFFAFVGDGSFLKLYHLSKSLQAEQAHNVELRHQLIGLRREVVGVAKNNRILEQTARRELGLARRGEILVVFDDEETTLETEQKNKK